MSVSLESESFLIGGGEGSAHGDESSMLTMSCGWCWMMEAVVVVVVGG